jgi:hypothetical protein
MVINAAAHPSRKNPRKPVNVHGLEVKPFHRSAVEFRAAERITQSLQRIFDCMMQRFACALISVANRPPETRQTQIPFKFMPFLNFLCQTILQNKNGG